MNVANLAKDSPLSGPQKAALVILGLDEAVAVEVLRHMDEADLAKLADTVSRYDDIPVALLDRAFEDFCGRMTAPAVGGKDGAAYVRKLASAAIGEDRAKRLLAPATQHTPLDTLRAARAQTLAELLADEHPQIAAVVLAQLERDQAAKVLQAMPQAIQEDIVSRILTLEQVPAQAALMASETVAKALASDSQLSESRVFDGVGFVAGILNEVGAGESERLLEALTARESPLVAKVRQKMFTFEDLLRVSARGIQSLMRELPSDTLLVALKTASDQLREHFLAGVSSRAAGQLRDDLSALPPMRLTEVEKAQREIVECAMRMSSEGRLTLPGPASEKLV